MCLLTAFIFLFPNTLTYSSDEELCNRVATFVNKYSDDVSDDDGLFSQVLSVLRFSFRFPFLCRRMYPISTSEQQQCYELLNFIIQLDLISSLHDSAASPGNDARGAHYGFYSPPLPGILFS